MSERVARSRELVAGGRKPAVVARVLQVTRQAIYRVPQPSRPPEATRRPTVDEVEAAIVRVAEQNPTDGYRIVTAWVARKVGRAVNRKRVLRVMRERKLIQRRRLEPRRRRPGFFLVERPGQLWHLDMTSVWVAELGAHRPLPREGGDRRDRGRGLRAGIRQGTLTLGTDNGSAFTARATRLVLSGLGVAHRRGG